MLGDESNVVSPGMSKITKKERQAGETTNTDDQQPKSCRVTKLNESVAPR